MKPWLGIGLGVLGGLLGAGLLLLIASPPRGETIKLKPAPTPQPLVVHVEGAVLGPGVYALDPGSRIGDAVEAAGGLLPDADAPALNLAARLSDGDQLRVPVKPPIHSDAVAGDLPGATSPGANPGTGSSTQIDINTATQAELETLPGIGPATAGKIVAFRQENGPFAAPVDIQRVSGIGPSTYEDLKDLITTGGSPLSAGP
jgi:competence protein ComEA